MNSLACYVYNATTYCDDASGVPPVPNAINWLIVGFVAGMMVDAVLVIGEKLADIIQRYRAGEPRPWS